MKLKVSKYIAIILQCT